MVEDKDRRKPSRRGFLTASAGIAAAIGSTAQAPGQAPADVIADDVTISLVNGRIHTMDASATVASTATIRNGRFRTVGGAPLAAGPSVRADRFARTHRGSRTGGTAHPHCELGESSRLSHHSGKHCFDSRGARGAGRAAQGRSRGRLDHLHGRLASQPMGRTPPSHSRRAG